MPTGRAIVEPRTQLFAAAERVLVRDGVNGLTSRAVTAEAGVAKGVLHRHFRDFDDFLVALVDDRTRRLAEQAQTLAGQAGQGDLIETITDALVELFDPLAVRMVALITARDELRERLRAGGHRGVPVLSPAAEVLVRQLRAEQHAGRLHADADAERLVLSLVGSTHLLAAGAEDRTADRVEVRAMVAAVLGEALR